MAENIEELLKMFQKETRKTQNKTRKYVRAKLTPSQKKKIENCKNNRTVD